MNSQTTKTLSLIVGAILIATLPFWAGDQYQLHLAALIAVYWILIAGLNLVVGFTGQLSIGHVGLLSIGSYTFAILFLNVMKLTLEKECTFYNCYFVGGGVAVWWNTCHLT
jgi:ABC-type branched-subunit amino acid transport system permease subunit